MRMGEKIMTASTSHALETEELTRVFGHFVAVDHISFAVEPGEIFGFLGPNGAGKTTTMRMLLSLLRPTSGSARVLGYDIVHDVSEIRRRIGYMSQRFSLYDDLTVAQNLTFFGGTHGLRRGRLRERQDYVLEMAGLAGREHEITGRLSGGWRQRLALGCAILHEPAMLFLDEPTAGVDPNSRREFWDLLYDLSAHGQTIMVTTHYMDEAERCNRLAFIQSGRIAALGTPEEIKHEQMPGQVVEIDCDAPGTALALMRAEPRHGGSQPIRRPDSHRCRRSRPPRNAGARRARRGRGDPTPCRDHPAFIGGCVYRQCHGSAQCTGGSLTCDQ